ncbi:hypothetical protein [Algoriphagus winogradskyi]|uniref:Uncharacterized protein n=1 Tax=Algoriphagus winogradskyi TaxID=237017 RepID=A0ABY1PDG8_9BACT|nr:hypothetical protein [Algoriphagus winogradskyi]SMP29792.1 hypothetical protein SAMN06265367_106185 [Algoriphagus winogradskyi]
MEDSLSLGVQNAETSIAFINFLAIIISVIGLLISGGVFLMHFRRDRRESQALERANRLDIGAFVLVAKYYEYKGHDQFTGEFQEEYKLEIPYQIHNKSNFPIIIETVFTVFKNPESGKHIKTFEQDFSRGQIVIQSLSSKNFKLNIPMADENRIKEVMDMSINLRIMIRGSVNPFSFAPQKLEIEFDH